MKIISFGYTWPALIYGPKCVTRREWKDRYAAMFHKGDKVLAYDRSPRFKGKAIAIIELTSDPYQEHIENMSDVDYVLEGFDYLYYHPEYIPGKLWGRPASKEDFSPVAFEHWRMQGTRYWVVRFKLIEVSPNA